MKPEFIASIIGTLITAVATIIVAAIQNPSVSNQRLPRFIRQRFIRHNPKKRNIWIIIIPISVIGGIAGYFLGMLIYFPIEITTTTSTSQTETFEKNTWMATMPIAGSQINFAPNLPFGQNIENVPTDYKMSQSPYSGIFLAYSGIDKVPTSWEVHYENGDILPAQSEKCYVNRGYPEMFQSPLILAANESSTTVTIFLDSRYSMIAKRIEVFVTSYLEPKANSEIDYVKAMIPGAGGMGLPFKSVRTKRVFVDKDLMVAYQVDFQDFILKPQEGVNIYVPLTFLSEGTYQLQFKIIGQAIPVFNGDKEGDFTLTTGRFSYGWLNLKEPLDYKVTQDGSGIVDLVPCP